MSTPLSPQPPKHPYYIYAPAYRETSAGIVVLHELCHALNVRGYEAYVVGTIEVASNLNTPLLTPAIMDRHLQNGLVPIAVYPEVVSGNPINAQVCVRYILNKIGFLTGRSMNEGADDLFFYYTDNFLGDRKKEDADFLFLPVISPDLFKPDPSKERTKTFVFQYRFPLEKIDFSLFPPDAELISMANPVSLPELAAKLQTGKVLYSYEASGVCCEAMMCGCPVIYMHEGGMTEAPDKFIFGTNGSAMASERNGLARATATVGVIHPIFVAYCSLFDVQLPYFIEQTQAASQKKHAGEQRLSYPGMFALQNPGRAPKNARPIVAVLSREHPFDPRSYVRFTKPFVSLEKHWELGWGIVDNSIDMYAIGKADLIVMHHLIPGQFTMEQLQQIFSLGLPVVYETDEALHDLPERHPRYAEGVRAKAHIEFVMRRAHAIVTSTDALAQKLRAFNSTVHVLPGCIDTDLFHRPVNEAASEQAHTVHLGLSASALQQSGSSVIEAALNEVLGRYQGQVQLFLFGTPPENWSRRADVTVVDNPRSYQEYAARLKASQLDITLLPGGDESLNADQPSLAWFEYSAAGTASICSDVAVFRELLKDGETGLLVADSSAAWVEAITRLIDHPQARRGMARTAQAQVLKRYSVQKNASRYHDTYLRCMDNVRPAAGGLSVDEPAVLPGVLILDEAGDIRKIEQTLASLDGYREDDGLIVVLTTLAGTMPEWTDRLRYLQATAAEYPAAAEQVCALADFHWTAITEAGVSLARA